MRYCLRMCEDLGHVVPGVPLEEYNRWRESFLGSNKRNTITIITDDGNCQGYLNLEEEDYFRKYFFILDVVEMKFKQFDDNPKKYPRHLSTARDLVDIRYISNVSHCTRSKLENAFEIQTPSMRHVLSADCPTEMNHWVTALTKAAINPNKAIDRCGEENPRNETTTELDDGASFTTSIIGGVVVKTPVCAGGRTGSDSSDTDAKNKLNSSTMIMRSLMEGWCIKQGARMKNWKRRYFRLNTIKLSYYENDVTPEPIRSIPSSNIMNVRILPKFSGRDDMLEVETPSRKFYMHVDDEHKPGEWKDALEKIMIQNGKYLPKTKSV